MRLNSIFVGLLLFFINNSLYAASTPVSLVQHTDYVSVFAFSPSGKLVASGGSSGSVKVTEVQTKKLVFELSKAHAEEVSNLSFNEDETRLVSSSTDGSVKMWNVPTGNLAATLLSGKGPSYVTFCPYSDYLVAGWWNQYNQAEIAFFQGAHKNHKAGFKKNEAGISSIHCAPKTETFATVDNGDDMLGGRADLYIWDALLGNPVSVYPTLFDDVDYIEFMGFMPDGQSFFIAVDTEAIWQVDATKQHVMKVVKKEIASISFDYAKLAPDGKGFLLVGDNMVSGNYELNYFDLSSGKLSLVSEISGDEELLVVGPQSKSILTGKNKEVWLRKLP